MNRPQITFASLAQEMLNMFEKLLGDKYFHKQLRSGNPTSVRLHFLKNIIDGQIQRETMSVEQAIDFYEALLDCTALQSATGIKRSVFQLPKVGDHFLLGKAKFLRSIFNESEQQLLDWYFQLLIHAWLSCKGFVDLKDARFDNRFRGIRVCDFIIEDEVGKVELVECKRIHPHKVVYEDTLSLDIKKIEERIADAAHQLNETAKRFDSVKSRHLFIDVSAYHNKSNEVILNSDPVEIIGFGDHHIKKLKESIDKSSLADIDTITICWRNLIFIDRLPCALIHKAISLKHNQASNSIFDYDGWTVEGYPVRDSRYRELRVSTTARSLDWIKTTYNNCSSPETFFTIGPVETIKN